MTSKAGKMRERRLLLQEQRMAGHCRAFWAQSSDGLLGERNGQEGLPNGPSYAARRLGRTGVDCRATWRAMRPALPPASRVSISEMLGVMNLSLGDGRRDARAHHPFTRAPAAAAPFPGLKGRSIPGTKHQPSPLPLRAAKADPTGGHIHELARRTRWEERNAPSIRRPASAHRTARCRAPIAALAEPGGQA